MDWLLSIIRIAGASFPVSSSLVQLQAEIDSNALLGRVEKLEDPISHLHQDVPEVSKELDAKLKAENSSHLEFDDDFYKKYSRALAALESQGFIEGNHMGKRYAAGLILTDPSYIMYLCAIAEDREKMESLFKLVDECEVGKWLDGYTLGIDLPIPVISSVFEIFESKGFGLCSQTLGTWQYVAQA